MKGLENLTQLEGLWLPRNQLTDVKGLKKLTRLTELDLIDNPALTKAQIDELQQALPKCYISSAFEVLPPPDNTKPRRPSKARP